MGTKDYMDYIGLYMGYRVYIGVILGIMEKKMETTRDYTTLPGRSRVQDSGFCV